MGEQADGSILVSSNQMITPLGKVVKVEGARPKDLAVSPDGSLVAVLTTGDLVILSRDGAAVASVPVKAGPLGVAWQPDGKAVYASGLGGLVYRAENTGKKWKATNFPAVDPKRPVKTFEAKDDSPESDAKSKAPKKSDPQATGLAVSPDGQRLYVGLGISNALSVLDLATKQTLAVIATGISPYRILLSPDGKTLYTANRGGSAPAKGEAQSTSAGTAVRIDPATDAVLRGSLSIIDTEAFTSTEVEAGRQPSALALSGDGTQLYVANSDEDSLAIFDTAKRTFTETLSLRPPQDPGFGQMPTSLALAGDGRTLYIACGGINAVATFDTAKREITGYLPASWYPIAVAEREGMLLVASSKGFGSRYTKEANRALKVSGSLGTVQFITPEQRAAATEHTRRVALNNAWGQEELPARPDAAPKPVPERTGEPSLFKHVVFIIKENHTFDSTLGDLAGANGDPSLCIFGDEVTPNQHALAREWVILDNTYTSGTNSADGHQWTTSAVANSYMEHNFSAKARSYPYDGGDPLAYSPKGFLWNAAIKAGRSLRVYGEFVNKPSIADRTNAKVKPGWKELWDDYQAQGDRYEIKSGTDNAALRPYLHPSYIGFPTTVSDQWRADQFLADLAGFERSGEMPALSILLLPNDHTTGTRPKYPTPRASVADNDLALGRMVEGLSHSRFWKEMLILVIEDDSQLGFDHVDGHRTIAYCVSPYTRRGEVVSEVYNHTSFLRTMELVLGLPSMNRFDRTATPMFACFTDQADERPFTHLPNRIPLDEMNPGMAALKGEQKRLAEASAKLDWSDVDRADATTVARAVWLAQRPGVAFPWKSFHPAVDDDDDGDGKR